MIKFTGAYTPEWQEDIYNTKLGQLCGYRDVLEYEVRVDRDFLNVWEIRVCFYKDGGAYYIASQVDKEFIRESGVLLSHMYTQVGVNKVLKRLPILDKAWKEVYE